MTNPTPIKPKKSKKELDERAKFMNQADHFFATQTEEKLTFLLAYAKRHYTDSQHQASLISTLEQKEALEKVMENFVMMPKLFQEKFNTAYRQKIFRERRGPQQQTSAKKNVDDCGIELSGTLLELHELYRIEINRGQAASLQNVALWAIEQIAQVKEFDQKMEKIGFKVMDEMNDTFFVKEAKKRNLVFCKSSNLAKKLSDDELVAEFEKRFGSASDHDIEKNDEEILKTKMAEIENALSCIVAKSVDLKSKSSLFNLDIDFQKIDAAKLSLRNAKNDAFCFVEKEINRIIDIEVVLAAQKEMIKSANEKNKNNYVDQQKIIKKQYEKLLDIGFNSEGLLNLINMQFENDESFSILLSDIYTNQHDANSKC